MSIFTRFHKLSLTAELYKNFEWLLWILFSDNFEQLPLNVHSNATCLLSVRWHSYKDDSGMLWDVQMFWWNLIFPQHDYIFCHKVAHRRTSCRSAVCCGFRVTFEPEGHKVSDAVSGVWWGGRQSSGSAEDVQQPHWAVSTWSTWKVNNNSSNE